MRRAPRWVGLVLACCAGFLPACFAPSTAGSVARDSYLAPGAAWSIDVPLGQGMCRVSDEQLPEQLNVLFAPKVPIGARAYQVAVTQRVAVGAERAQTDEERWFEILIERLERAQGRRARLLAKERFPGVAARGEQGLECWARAYVVEPPPAVAGAQASLALFLLRPLPARAGSAGRGAVLFSAEYALPAERTPLGEDPPLSLPVRDGWRELIDWSATFEVRALVDGG